MTISEWLMNTTEQFSRSNIPSARLDAELILCHMLGVDRTWLAAHGDESLARAALSHTNGVHPGGIKAYGEKLVLGRLKRQPIAYLLGHKEFYGRDFTVNKHVLIPRPETEALIELAKKHGLSGNLLDVGTGSGAIGLTLWHELQDISLTLSDISEEALEIARKNAKQLKVKPVRYVTSDLLDHWVVHETPQDFDVIVANLPYVDRSWERSPETDHEPYLALFARDGGLELIKRLIDQAAQLLKSGSYLLLEADPEQHSAIIEHGKAAFEHIDTDGYALLLQKSFSLN